MCEGIIERHEICGHIGKTLQAAPCGIALQVQAPCPQEDQQVQYITVPGYCSSCTAPDGGRVGPAHDYRASFPQVPSGGHGIPHERYPQDTGLVLGGTPNHHNSYHNQQEDGAYRVGYQRPQQSSQRPSPNTTTTPRTRTLGSRTAVDQLARIGRPIDQTPNRLGTAPDNPHGSDRRARQSNRSAPRPTPQPRVNHPTQHSTNPPTVRPEASIPNNSVNQLARIGRPIEQTPNRLGDAPSNPHGSQPQERGQTRPQQERPYDDGNPSSYQSTYPPGNSQVNPLRRAWRTGFNSRLSQGYEAGFHAGFEDQHRGLPSNPDARAAKADGEPKEKTMRTAREHGEKAGERHGWKDGYKDGYESAENGGAYMGEKKHRPPGTPAWVCK